jgi:hypothetical protein
MTSSSSGDAGRSGPQPTRNEQDTRAVLESLDSKAVRERKEMNMKTGMRWLVVATIGALAGTGIWIKSSHAERYSFICSQDGSLRSVTTCNASIGYGYGNMYLGGGSVASNVYMRDKAVNTWGLDTYNRTLSPCTATDYGPRGGADYVPVYYSGPACNGIAKIRVNLHQYIADIP